MQIHPKEPSEAYSESRKLVCVAASSPSPIASSPAPALRDSQPAPCRGGGAGQPFPFADETKRRCVGPIPPHILRRIFNDDQALNNRPAELTFREGLTPLLLGALAALFAAVVIAYGQSHGWIAQ